ncbi:hypothetical protein [Methanobrevibacter sp.]
MKKNQNIKIVVYGTLPAIPLKALRKTKCPHCETVGEYETDENLNTYCKNCGLVVDAPYKYTAGIKFDLLHDILHKKKS